MRNLIKSLFWLGLVLASLSGCTTENLESDPSSATTENDTSVVTTESSETLYSGFQIDGTRSSCKPIPPETICTTVYTDEDRWADKCREEGGTVIRCACHSYLCSEKIEP